VNNILHLISKRLKEIAVEEADAPWQTKSPQPMTVVRCSVQQSSSAQRNPPCPSLSKTPMATSWEWTEAKQEPSKTGSSSSLLTNKTKCCSCLRAPNGHTPITEEEVKTAITALQNSRVADPDDINSEHSKNIVSRPLAKIINSLFEHHVLIETLGEGTLITLPKPKKSPGPPIKLWLIVLLNSIRKIMSSSLYTASETRSTASPDPTKVVSKEAGAAQTLYLHNLC